MPPQRDVPDSPPPTQDAFAGAQQGGSPPPVDSQAAAKSRSLSVPKVDKDILDTVLGLLVWVAIIGIPLLIAYWPNRVPVTLEIDPAGQIWSAVSYQGQRVAGGVMRLAFHRIDDGEYIGGTLIRVGPASQFRTTIQNVLHVSKVRGPTRVTAAFSGTSLPNKDGHTRSISGATMIYLNAPPPIGKNLLWASIVVVVGLLGSLVVLFTGHITRRKARLLFGITYVITGLAFVAPLATIIAVSNSEYLVGIMKEAPVGLIKGTAAGVSDPQWLINIGGSVRRKAPSPAVDDTSARKSNAGGQASDTSLATGEPLETTPDTGRVVGITPSHEERTRVALMEVEGGLAVPFYVLVLAILGAAINMTKKVPAIQNRYDLELESGSGSLMGNALRATWRAHGVGRHGPAPPIDRKRLTAIMRIRKELIENYMFLLSAPFLAIAVYYVLQVAAKDIEEPVLVVTAFATGFISDPLISWITSFASRALGAPGASAKEQERLKAVEKATQKAVEASHQAEKVTKKAAGAAHAAAEAIEDTQDVLEGSEPPELPEGEPPAEPKSS